MTPSLFGTEALLKLGYQGQLPEEYETKRILPQAIAEYQAMVSSRERLFGSAHFSTRRLRSLLADILYRNGQLEESAELLWKDIKTSEEDEKSRDELLVLKSKLALTYEDLGRLDESESLMKEVLDGYSTGPQQDEVGRMVTLFNLTSISLERGNNEEAINRGVVAVKESLRVLGPDHNNTLIAKSTLALAYNRAGQLDQAVDLNLEVAQARERSISSDPSGYH
jgi:Tetratricopeptide repeat